MIENIMYALYIILGIAPFSIIRYYPFYSKLRVKPLILWLIFSLVLAIEVVWFIAIEYNESVFFVTDNELLRLLFYVVYLAISIILIKDAPSKHILVWAVCMIFSSTFTSFTYWIDSISPSEIPFLTGNLVRILLLPFFMYLGFIFINKHIMPLINQSNFKINRLICTLLILIFFMGLLTAKELPSNTSSPFSVLTVRLLACVITIFICYIFSGIIKEQNEIMKIMEENKQKEKMLDVSTEQFIALSDKIEETRRARHDLKFHISAIKSFANNQDYKSLLEYIDNDYLQPNDNILVYCNNPTLNILFSYYRDLAEASKIIFKVEANVTSEIFLSNNELWVLLGNLLENSIEASKHMTTQSRIVQVKIHLNEHSLVLTVDNKFDEYIIKRDGENFFSTKENGGVGLSSVAFLAEKHNGLATFETKNGWFMSSVTMYG